MKLKHINTRQSPYSTYCPSVYSYLLISCFQSHIKSHSNHSLELTCCCTDTVLQMRGLSLIPSPIPPPPPLCRETNYSIPAHVYDEAAENNDVSLSLSVAFEYVFGIKEAGMLILQRIDSTRLSGTIILDLSPRLYVSLFLTFILLPTGRGSTETFASVD